MNKNIRINGKILSRYNEILSEGALKFIEEIHQNFNNERLELLSERKKRQEDINKGNKLEKSITDNDSKIIIVNVK